MRPSVELNEGYVIGLLADLERQAPALLQQLQEQRGTASAIENELSTRLQRIDGLDGGIKKMQNDGQAAALEINDRNAKIAALHQEKATLSKRNDEIKVEMDRLIDEEQLRRKLRRERARLQLQIEERDKAVASLAEEVAASRQRLHECEERLVTERDKRKSVVQELDVLQEKLPSPYLFTQLFEVLAAQAHCHMFLDRDVARWRAELRAAMDWMLQLHTDLRTGKYRLDRNSDLVGGRAAATAEALMAAVATGDSALAAKLFELACDRGLFFHEILNVFRTWSVGLCVTGQIADLRDLLLRYRYAEGLRGGYVQCLTGLLTQSERLVRIGLKDIARFEWELWQDPRSTRGMGVVNVGAVALSRLAIERGIAVSIPGPTIPLALIS